MMGDSFALACELKAAAQFWVNIAAGLNTRAKFPFSGAMLLVSF
jgi:hypothetical protein